MKLVGITITGADHNSISPGELVAFCSEYPFFEPGILYSATREGQPRYPPMRWIDELNAWSGRGSLHLCGKVSCTVLAGEDDYLYRFLRPSGYGFFRRVQLNGFTQFLELNDGCYDELEERVESRSSVSFILQVQTLRAFTVAANLVVRHPNVTPLWDPSGGRGIASNDPPTRWPTCSIPRTGYAGGIGEGNVAATIEALQAVAPQPTEFWLDMESSVRSLRSGVDVFDLEKVRRILEIAKPYFEKKESHVLADRP